MREEVFLIIFGKFSIKIKLLTEITKKFVFLGNYFAIGTKIGVLAIEKKGGFKRHMYFFQGKLLKKKEK